MSKLSYKARAAAGAKLLDEIDPEWFWDIELQYLDIGNSEYCILGQMYGEWARGVYAISEHLTGTRQWLSREQQSSLGFQYTYAECQKYDTEVGANTWLVRRWTEEIKTRRSNA